MHAALISNLLIQSVKSRASLLINNPTRVLVVFKPGVPNLTSTLSHIAVTIFQTLNDQGHVALFEGIEHVAAIPLDAEDAFEAHVLQVVGNQGLFTSQHVTDFGDRELGVLFQQVDDSQPQGMGYGLQDESGTLQPFGQILVNDFCFLHAVSKITRNGGICK